MEGGTTPEYGTSVLLSTKERREILGRLGGALYYRAEEIGEKFNMERCISGNEVFNETIQYFRNEIKKLYMKGKLRLHLGTEITYSDMKRLISSSYSMVG